MPILVLVALRMNKPATWSVYITLQLRLGDMASAWVVAKCLSRYLCDWPDFPSLLGEMIIAPAVLVFG